LTYRLERPIGGRVYRLRVEAELKMPVMLHVEVTCPGLSEIGPWHAVPATSEPAFEPAAGRLSWNVRLPFGGSDWNWTWG
jgi:hypothetical protein